jgi:hypothetical protein
MVNICPVCGYSLQWPPMDFHICPSCGTEFGYDDAGESHANLRLRWLEGGACWWSTSTPPPPNWNPYVQIDNLLVGLFPAAFHATRYGQAPPRMGLSQLMGSGAQQQGASKAGLSSLPESQRAVAA